ncbi:hypothetical protein MRX96_005948 [Rhipicephalus microplus]
MSVHYKFKSSLDFDTVTFDGLHISVGELKKNILQQKKIGKGADFDLQITNAQTKEVYTSDDYLVPKNTSVIVARVPVTTTGRKNCSRERNRDGEHSVPDVIDATSGVNAAATNVSPGPAAPRSTVAVIDSGAGGLSLDAWPEATLSSHCAKSASWAARASMARTAAPERSWDDSRLDGWVAWVRCRCNFPNSWELWITTAPHSQNRVPAGTGRQAPLALRSASSTVRP